MNALREYLSSQPPDTVEKIERETRDRVAAGNGTPRDAEVLATIEAVRSGE